MRDVTQMLPDDGYHDFALFAAGCITNTAPRSRRNLRTIDSNKAEVSGGHGRSPYERLMRQQANAAQGQHLPDQGRPRWKALCLSWSLSISPVRDEAIATERGWHWAAMSAVCSRTLRHRIVVSSHSEKLGELTCLSAGMTLIVGWQFIGPP
jgi:hypothetical protein